LQEKEAAINKLESDLEREKQQHVGYTLEATFQNEKMGPDKRGGLFEHSEHAPELMQLLAQIDELEGDDRDDETLNNVMKGLRDYATNKEEVRKTLQDIQEEINDICESKQHATERLPAYIFGIILCEMLLLHKAKLPFDDIPFTITSLTTSKEDHELLGADKIATIDSVYYFLRVAIGIADEEDENRWEKRRKILVPGLVEVTRFMFLFLDGVSKATGIIEDVLEAVDAEPNWETLKNLVTDPALRAQTLADVDFPLVSHTAYHVVPSHSWFQPVPAYETAQQASCSGLSGFTQQLPPATYHYAHGQMY
jgi:hypothetical protein